MIGDMSHPRTGRGAVRQTAVIGSLQRPRAGNLTLRAVTTAAGQTVRLQRVRLTTDSEVRWGDGTTTPLPANMNNDVSRTYANAGTYDIVIPNAQEITQLHLADSRLSMLNTEQLQHSFITSFQINNLSNCQILSDHMSKWNITSEFMVSGNTGLHVLNTAHMANWRPTLIIMDFWRATITGSVINSFDLSAMNPTALTLVALSTGATITINSSHFTGWNIMSFFAMMCSVSGNYLINTEHIAHFRPTTLNCNTMHSSGTYNFNTHHFRGMNPTDIRFHNLPAGTVTINDVTDFNSFLRCTTARFENNSWNQTMTDRCLQAWWNNMPTRTATRGTGTINVGGTNAAPSGIFQNATPPTTGKEFAWKLLFESAPARTWATVTTN